jgi:hypothetical protein
MDPMLNRTGYLTRQSAGVMERSRLSFAPESRAAKRAAACTRSIGRVFVEHFENGASLIDFPEAQCLQTR